MRTNYYQAINKKWLEKAEIPSDQPSNGVFYELNEQVKDKMKADDLFNMYPVILIFCIFIFYLKRL